MKTKYYLMKQELTTSSSGYTDYPSSVVLADSYSIEKLQNRLREEVNEEVSYASALTLIENEPSWAVPLVELNDYALIIRVNKLFHEIHTQIIVFSITERLG